MSGIAFVQDALWRQAYDAIQDTHLFVTICCFSQVTAYFDLKRFCQSFLKPANVISRAQRCEIIAMHHNT